MRKTFLLVCLLALCNLTAFAQTEEVPRVAKMASIDVASQPTADSKMTIYSNLGTETNRYSKYDGFTISGPGHGRTQFDAMPFTPKTNSHVSQVRVAVVYNASGANQVNLSIYGDSNGIPGTLLAGPVTVTDLPNYGTCCTLAVANFTPLALTGGSQYWVVADTPASGTGSDFYGTWAFVVQKIPPNAVNVGDGWYTDTSVLEQAGEVLGTIP